MKKFQCNLTDYLRGEKRERKLNRFSVSDLYYLLQGWTSLEEHINGKNIPLMQLWDMKKGEQKHQWIQDSPQFKEMECEIKRVCEVDGLEIVGRADALAKDYGVEIKTGKARETASRSQEYQAKMYCTMFEKPIFYIVQPYINNEMAYLKTIGVVERDDKWFQKQVEKIKLKYEELKKWNIKWNTNKTST